MAVRAASASRRPAPLDRELLLGLDQRLVEFKVVRFRARRMVIEDLPYLDPLLQHR